MKNGRFSRSSHVIAIFAFRILHSRFAMPDPAPNPELLHSLGRLVRGLSALFWGLPVALIVCVGTAMAGWFQLLSASCRRWRSTGLLLFGLWQLDSFQKQERPWRNALDRAKIFALINFGLSPFVFWWNRQPGIVLLQHFDWRARVVRVVVSVQP